MIIEYLQLKNFMKIRDASLELPPGAMPILSGGNGNGKSAVFYAIALVLTGYKKGSTYRDYIRRGSKAFEVHARFRLQPDGELFESHIVCSSTKTIPMKKELLHNGHTFTGSDYDVYLARFIDTDLLNAITFSLQGQSDLSQYKPWQLRNLLKTVFKLDFDRERDMIAEVTSVMQERIKEYAAQVEAYRSTLAMLDNEPDILDRPPTSSRIQNAEQTLEALVQERSDLEGVTAELRELELHLEMKKRDLTARQRESEHVEHVRIREERALEASQQTLDKLKQKRSLLLISEEEIDEARIATQVHERREMLAQYKHDTRTISVKIDIAQKGKCPTCEREAPQEWTSVIETLRTEKQVSEDQVTELNARIALLQKDLEAARDITSQRRSVENAIEYESLQVEKHKTAIQEARAQEQASGLKQLIEQLQVECRELSETKTVRERYHTEALERLQSVRSEIVQAQSHVSALQQQLNEYTTKLEMMEKAAARKATVETKLQEISAELQTLREKVVPHDTALRIVDKYLPSFGVLLAGQKVVQQMLSIIHPVLPGWDLRLATARDGVTFEYRDTEEGEDAWSSIALASGFENALCSVAFKLTLTAFYGLPMMILDEVDAAAEDANSYRVFDSISQFRQAYGIYQTWIVSHKKQVVEQLIREYGGGIQHYEVIDGEFELLWRSDN